VASHTLKNKSLFIFEIQSCSEIRLSVIIKCKIKTKCFQHIP
jgi:hypothetical protein